MQRRPWTNPFPPSILTMHGRAYHRMFDLQQQYSDVTVAKTVRFHIYDSEFHTQSRALRINHNTASSLRTYFQQNIPWAGSTKVQLMRCYVTLVLPPSLRVYIFLYSLLFCGDFGGVSSCVANVHEPTSLRVFTAGLTVENVVDFFASTYHELVDTSFSYLLLILA